MRRGSPAPGLGFALAVAVLVLFSVARTFGVLGPPAESIGLLVGALALIAWFTGATLDDLGLGWADAREGLLYGAGAVALVLLVLVVAAVIPATNGFLHDSRAQISGDRLVYDLGVSIVLFTAIPEEFAFRGVLLGSGLRMWGPWRASLASSALFGLWHIAPTLHTMSGNPGTGPGRQRRRAGTGGAYQHRRDVHRQCCLRLAPSWSESLIASVMAQASVDGLALTVAWFTVCA